MREIKFRAYDKRKGYLNYDLAKDDGGINEFDLMFCLAFPDRFEIMQFTGLKDKNGKEIYEGDIVRFRGNYCVKEYCGEQIAKVYWDDYDCQFRFYMFDGGSMELNNHHDNSLEIIGNIYENPELMKQ